MNKILISIFLTVSLIAAPALAQKQDSAGNGKLSEEKKNLHQSATQGKDRIVDDVERGREHGKKVKAEKHEKLKKQRDDGSKALKEEKEKVKKQRDDELKGLEKQKAKKSEQVQKELDKGSEQGQEARSGRKKWWKFWGDE